MSGKIRTIDDRRKGPLPLTRPSFGLEKSSRRLKNTGEANQAGSDPHPMPAGAVKPLDPCEEAPR
jgi:hypothetical protein